MQLQRSKEKSAPIAQFSLLWEELLPDGVDAMLQTKKNDSLRNQYLAEVAYLRGDFAQAKRFSLEALGSNATYICASMFSLFIAISTNDFELYSRIEAPLKRRDKTVDGHNVSMLADIVLAAVAVSMFAPQMVPVWLKEGDFSRLPEEAIPFAMYLRVKYLQNLADYPQMFAVVHTMFTLYKGKGIVMDIYLLLMCAAACIGLDNKIRAREFLQDSLMLGMTHGFITPFVENIANLNGLVEDCVKQQYPHAYDTLIAQWQGTWRNWAVFHNRFARDNVPLILTLREHRIATLAANRIPYAQIARQECVSVGRLRNIMQEIYGKLFVRNRDELAALVLWTPKKT